MPWAPGWELRQGWELGGVPAPPPSTSASAWGRDEGAAGRPQLQALGVRLLWDVVYGGAQRSPSTPGAPKTTPSTAQGVRAQAASPL